MKSFWLLFSFLTLTISAKCQLEEDAVKAVVNNLFTAMKTSDGGLLKTCFADSAVLQTIVKNREGMIEVKTELLEAFIISINAAKKGSLDERITFDAVKVDGPLAIAWTPYSFYYEDKFLHCGVNSFQLVKINNQWKIQYLIDTRKKDGCK